MNNITEREGVGAPQPPTFDPDQYRHYLAEYDLSDEEEAELIIALWSIIQIFVDMGFGADPLQLLFSELEAGGSDEGKK